MHIPFPASGLAAAWTQQDPALVSALQDHLAGVPSGADHDPATLRAVVADAIAAGYRRSGLGIPSALERFRAGARTVTTGHQLVVAGGPAYLHAKAMTAIRRAGPEGVAVFWLASEDHDAAEAGTLPRRSLRWIPAEGTPVGRWTVDDALRDQLATWADEAALHPADRAALLRHAVPGRPYADVFRCWMDAWFGGTNLLVLDGDDPALKALAAPLLRAELTGHGVAAPVAATTAVLEAAGFPAQAQPRPINLFEFVPSAEGTTRRIRVDAPLPDAALEPWERWSPGVLLRPLYQEWLLGSDEVVGGPAEVAYWLQCAGAFRALGVPFPRIVLRDGVLVHTTSSANAAQAIGWEPGLSAQRTDELFRQWLTARAVPADRAEAIATAFKALEQAWTAAAAAIDPTLEAAARASAARTATESDALTKKLRKGYAARHAHEVAATETGLSWLLPGGLPQERVSTALELAAELGGWDTWRSTWLAAAHAVPFDHPPVLWIWPDPALE